MQYFLGLVAGVFMCCFGLYEKIVDSILHFFKDIKGNLKFLFPIAFGVFIGIFLFGNILKFVFDKFYMEACFAFIGLILGSLNLIIKQSNIKKVNFLHILCLLLTFSFSLYLLALESSLNVTTYMYSNSYLILAGCIMSAGIVVPGISKTVILMILGLYPVYLSAISSLNLSILLPLGIGLIIGGLLFLCLINFLFKFVKSYTYFGIIGFIIGSIFVIYPGFTFDIKGFISLLILVLSYVIGIKLSRLDSKGHLQSFNKANSERL